MTNVIKESMKTIHRVGFMIPSSHEKVGRMESLPSTKGQKDFHRLWSTINKVTIEQVGVVRGGIAIQSKDC